MSIAVLVTGAVLAAGALLRWWHHSRHLIGEREEAVQFITKQLPIADPNFRNYPARGVEGRYGAHPIAVESFPRKTKRGIQSCFHIHIEVAPLFRGRLYIQSALRHSKVTHLYGMEIMLTDDVAFDRELIVMGSDPDAIRPLLTAYLRSRLHELHQADFSADFSRDSILIDVIQPELKPEEVVEIIRTLTELADIAITHST